ncbi:hypothetical protein KJ693_00055 [bacterium]|nr:hypothetical protein [bacterium]
MRNEILEELWQSKDAVAKEYGYDIDRLVKGLREKEESEKVRVIDLSTEYREEKGQLHTWERTGT